MKFEKKIWGYALLAVGLIMIFSSVYLLITVFNGVSAPPNLFDFSDVSFMIPLTGEVVQIMSGEDMNRIAGMGSWYTLMFFIMVAGSRIASLGIDFTKEIKVEVKINEKQRNLQNQS
jgi:hypothetical protein